MLGALLSEDLLSYVAMDIKNSRDRYGETIGIPDFRTDRVEQSVKLLMESSIRYEFRTTLMAELHDDTSMEAIGQWIRGAKAYYLQSYRDSEEIMVPGRFHAPSKETVERFREIVHPYVPSVSIRGID